MSTDTDLQFVHDAEGKPVDVIAPIDLWRKIESERETAYLLQSPAMKQRLMEAKNRTAGSKIDPLPPAGTITGG